MMFKRAISVLLLSLVSVDVFARPQVPAMQLTESRPAAGGAMENVEFDPPMQVVDVASGNTVASFAVTLGLLEIGSFRTLNMLLGSDSLTVSAFTYSPEFVAATTSRLEPPVPFGIYPSDLAIGGYNPTPISAPIMVGVLEVDTAGLPCGDYEIVVNSDQDFGFSLAQLYDGVLFNEYLFGSATARVIDGSCPPCDTDSDCDDENLCNGIETCDPSFGHCIQGSPPDCNDNIPCTVDSCNAELNACSNQPNHSACSDGLYCNGSEKCVPGVGCRPGPRPCPPSSCNEAADACRHMPPAALRGPSKKND